MKELIELFTKLGVDFKKIGENEIILPCAPVMVSKLPIGTPSRKIWEDDATMLANEVYIHIEENFFENQPYLNWSLIEFDE